MKKRLFTLCLALTVVTFGAMAAEELYVGGKKVALSGSGKVTVSGGDIKSGSVTYDRDTKTLTLSGVTITRSGNNNRGIRSSVSGLTVKFVGTNKITTTSAAGLRFEASTTITGSGTVTVKSNETALYVNKNTTVSISGVDRNRLTLNLDGKYGIQGEDGNSGEKVSIQRYVTLTASGSDNALTYLNNLTVSSDANVTLKGNDTNPTINSLASLTLTKGIALDQPLGGKFDSSYKTIPEGKYMIGYKGDITIKPAIVCIISENFPDFNFCTYILQIFPSCPIDKNWDGYLSNAEIQATTSISVSSEGIKDLTGIAYFTALRELRCNNNSLTSLDVSKNTALTELRCSGNQISGAAMTSLVNSLRSLPSGTEGRFIVCDDKAETDNDITTAQVKVATDKGWTVQKYDSKGKAVDYAGFDPVAIDATNFPDENFRNYLLAQDYGKDSFLTESEIKCITEVDVVNKGIKDLTGIEYLTGLRELFCWGNSLKSLDVSKNTALVSLYCYNNSLESLDVSANTTLKYLSCGNNSLKSLDVSNNTALTELDCERNSLKSLDVSKNTKLTDLYCHNNSLTSLDVSKNTALTDLYCYNNRLESLDVSKNTALRILFFYGNQISGEAMTILVNSLRSLPYGTNGYFYVCDDRAETDNDITTAQVKVATDKGWTVQKYDSKGKAVDYAGEEPGIAIDATNFPDENFRSYLLAQDYGKDGILTEDEILAVTELGVDYKGIKDLTGIGYFTALMELDCHYNSLESLDVSKNTALKELKCSHNSLKSLDVSKNTALTELYCGYNSLTTLDVSNNKDLTSLGCSGNSLKSLDVSKNTLLTELECSNNSLTSLDVSKNTALTTKLSCSSNSLQSLDVSKNTKLTDLYCSNNSLQSLDVSKNTALTDLYCDNNCLQSLDVSKNTALTWLVCSGNQISGTAMTKLVNSLPSLPSGTNGYFYVCDDRAETDNVITTAQVKVATDKGWTVQKYDSDGYSVDYAGFEPIAIDATNFPDEKFRNYLLAKDFGKDGYLTEKEIIGITYLRIDDKGIKSLTGIEHFTALTSLSCRSNSLTSLDVSACLLLKSLYCDNNSLTSLIVSNISLLDFIWCFGNQINGTAMTQLVNSLPTRTSNDGEIMVCADFSSPDNIITATQVNIAKGKGWMVQKAGIILGDDIRDYAGQGDVNGDGKIDQNDLDAIVKIVMGHNPDPDGVGVYASDMNNDGKIDDADVALIVGVLAGDLNNDGKVDAADIVVMINILKELKGK